jgi:hypothetical protein
MKRNQLSLEMMPLQEFARLFGYPNWTDPQMHKKHSSFMNEFREGEWIPKDFVNFYISTRGLGTFIIDIPPSDVNPTNCCRSKSNQICLSESKLSKLIETISRLEKLQNPVPEALIWYDIFMQLDSCFLKNYVDYRYSIFELKEAGRVIQVVDAGGQTSYSVTLVPIKRGRGRPRTTHLTV